jgi:hypothetical protein
VANTVSHQESPTPGKSIGVSGSPNKGLSPFFSIHEKKYLTDGSHSIIRINLLINSGLMSLNRFTRFPSNRRTNRLAGTPSLAPPSSRSSSRQTVPSKFFDGFEAKHTGFWIVFAV